MVQLFGKLPTHGDFLARGLSPAERDALDGWMSAGLSDVRGKLGAEFEDLYDRAPPWRFVTRAGALMNAGVMIPSIDSAGRRFPFYLAGLGLAPAQALDAAAQCEALLYRAFEEAWTVDRLAGEAGSIVPQPGETVHMEAVWWTAGGEDFPPVQLSGERPSGLFQTLLSARQEKA
ncbi:type VI secretion system-associated protein TagF [Allosphingosinicella deserti]|nr:type VI secretion system-associated protein TagF [Sphingomonas deserti]